MANFIGLDDAATKLGVAKDKLNDLREAGKLRAYRDGTSWKFRAEEIEDLAKNGLPPMDSDIGDAFGLGIDDDPDSASLELGGLELDSEGAASDADLSLVDEPTVAADEPAPPTPPAPAAMDDDDDDLVLDLEGSGDDAESILLGEDDLGATSGPSSTIIGRNDLSGDDDDLELAPADPSTSDVRLDDEPTATTPSEPSPPTPPPGKFEDIEELEIDLEAESSRILEAEEVAAAKEAAAKSGLDAVGDSGTADSDLALAPSESGDNLSGLSSLASDEADQVEEGLTGISSLNVDEGAGGGGSSLSGLSSIELADDEDDDFVLGDSGSDITLSGAESGINLVAPSDSGLSLDEASAILGGSAINPGVELSDVAAASSPAMESGELSSSEDFMLTPLGDDDEDEEDSSQIVSVEALDEDAGDGDDVVLGGALAMDSADASAGEAAGPAVVEDASFSVWNVLGLGSCLTIMLVCGVMMVDLVRAIWAWDEPTDTSSALIEGLLGLVGM